ncbi:MAG: GHKL domain-containing protein [Lachnospiraceae bacterium]|nr:GHKL domain-containing protein [Lachnospiraceae bacterium]
MGQYGVMIASVPTLLFFFAMSKHRNAQFVIAFCFSDTVCIWIEMASALIDHAVGSGGVVTFILRLISIPLLEYAVYRWLRKPYLEISHLVRRGWLLFAALTGVCYLILVLLSVYPTIILDRPQDIPLAVVVLILIALVYATIFLVLFEQLHNLKAQERQRILEAQADQRHIICKSVIHPRFMIEISNSYAGEVTFDQWGVPVADKPGHGIGTRSIVAFAEKHNALYRFQAENGWFKLQIAV